MNVEEMKQIANSKKLKGNQWMDVGGPALVEITAVIKDTETEKEEATRTLKDAYDAAAAPYLAALKVLNDADKALRARLLTECDATESLMMSDGEHLAELVFSGKWTFSVDDMTAVPLEFMTVDTAKVNAAIKDGRRAISGLSIQKVRSLQVRMKA